MELSEKVPFDVVLRVLKNRPGAAAWRAGYGKLKVLKLQTPDLGSKMTEPYFYAEYRKIGGGVLKREPWALDHADMLAEDWYCEVPE